MSSVSPHESVIEEDVHGQRQTLPNGDYKRVQKRYYRKKDEHVFEDWTVEYAELIQREILDKRRKTPSLWTFLKYRPNNVQKGDKYEKEKEEKRARPRKRRRTS